MTASVDPTRFDEMYRDDRTTHGLPAATPWDIGGPQPVVKQLVSLGAVKGEVLDPGTGPGHHAIYYASQGLSSTGIDASPAAIARARANADRAGVPVNFQVADATKLDGFDGRFDTVVDCAFYHTFSTDEALQKSYFRALHRATKPGAQLFMFEFGEHNVNGLAGPRAIPEENFREMLPGGRLADHLPRTDHLPDQREHPGVRGDGGAQPRSRREHAADAGAVPDHRAAVGQRARARAVLGSARHSGRLTVDAVTAPA